jgi:outer membrane protein TolC
MNFKYIASLLLFGFLALSVSAQDSLSIEQAIGIGLSNNFQIKISDKQVDIAENNNTWGKAGAYPTINFMDITSVNATNNVNGVSPSLTEYNSQQTILNQLSVELNWVLFSGLRIITTKAQLADLQAQSEGNAVIIVENTLQSILLSYYLAKLQEEALEVSEEVLKLSRDRYNYVKSRKDFGSAGTFDVLQAENNYLTDSANVLRAQLNFENALRNLNLTIAEPIENIYTLSSDFDLDNNIRDFILGDLIAKLESNNKTLRNQYIYQEILKKNVTLSQSRLYPSLNLGMGVNLNNTGTYYDGQNGTWNDNFGSNGSLSLVWTLSDGGNVRRAIQNARIEEEIGELQLEDMRRVMYNQLFNSLADYNIKRQLRQVALLNVKSSRLNLDIAEEKFRSGAINSFNYRDIQIVYFNAAREQLQANFNLVEAYTELMRLTGGIVEDLTGGTEY